MLDLPYKVLVVERKPYCTVGSIPASECPYMLVMWFHARYWSNEFKHSEVYMRHYHSMAAWCYKNLGEHEYVGVTGQGRRHWFLIKSKQKAMLAKLALV